MKPFDLEAAKRGEPIQTRNGEPARFIAHVPDAERRDERVIVFISGSVVPYYESGQVEPSRQSDDDLFMAPRKRTVWINLYEYTNASDRFDAYAYVSEEMANNARCADRIGGKAWPLEIEG